MNELIHNTFRPNDNHTRYIFKTEKQEQEQKTNYSLLNMTKSRWRVFKTAQICQNYQKNNRQSNGCTRSPEFPKTTLKISAHVGNIFTMNAMTISKEESVGIIIKDLK